MATKEKEYGYFPHSYFGASYFPAVWFAPAFEVLTDEDELEVIHGPGVYHEKREARSSRDFDFLDPEYHKKRIAPKVKQAIAKVARKAVQKPTQEAPKEAQESPTSSEWVDSLIAILERENIAFKRFYADLLQQQIEEQRNAQIRLQLELLGIYQQIEEEDEQAIMLLMMEL